MTLSDNEKLLRALNRIARALERSAEVNEFLGGRIIESDEEDAKDMKEMQEHIMFQRYEDEI